MTTVDFELIHRIQQHINRTEKQAALLPERKKWLQLTSALDTLEDTSWAVEYYISSEYPDDFKGKYLYTYGLLQALFVQMDAVSGIQESLFGSRINYKEDYPDAYQVREMRDDVTGHPTDRRGHHYIHLAQGSLNKSGFYYQKSDSNLESGSDEFIEVSIDKAISDVSKCINKILSEAVATLDRELTEYYNMHRGRKMKEIFQNLNYARENVRNNKPLADSYYKSTKTMVQKCEEELKLRYGSVEAKDSYKDLLTEIHELYDLIDNALLLLPEKPIDYRGMSKKYYNKCLFDKLKKLEEYAEETDEYFENYGQE